MKELVRELEILTQSAADEATKVKLIGQAAERAGVAIATKFGVREHEVAILLLSPKKRILKFEYPKALRNSGTIPLAGRVTGKDAVAVRTFTTRRGEVLNAMSTTKHLAIFEMIKVDKETPQPIQKMMSAPLLEPGGNAVGVVQVSRKGESAARAGADFSDADLKELGQVGAELGPFLARIVPEFY